MHSIIRQLDSIEPLEPRRLLSAGQLDPSFGDGTGGITLGSYPNFKITAIASDSFGQVIVAGYTGTDWWSPTIERFTVHGAEDDGFGDTGKVSLDFGGTQAAINRILIESDNTILCLGSTRDTSGNQDMAMAKLTFSGGLDPSFGNGGEITFDAGGNDDELTQAAESANNTVVIAGSAGDSGSRDAFVGRIHESDGSFDTTFSGDGKATVDFNNLDDTLTGMTVLSNGDVDIATESTGYIKKLGLARLTAVGTLDSTFSGDGRNTDTSFHTAGMFADSDNKLLVIGTEDGNPAQIQIRRYNSDGGVDKTFGTDGRADIALENVVALDAVAQQEDGKFILAGSILQNSAAQPFLVRIDATGAIDSIFAAGDLSTSSNADDSIQTKLALSVNGRTLVALNTFRSSPTASGESAVFALTGDSSPVTIQNGVLTVTGTDDDDTMLFSIGGTNQQIVTSINGFTGVFDIASAKSISIHGGDGDDSIVLSDLGNLSIPVSVDGGDGDDIILGSASAESINGGAGNDTIHGAGGDDIINGDAGDDQLFGEKGSDTIIADAGFDNLSGGSGDDVLQPGGGVDDTDTLSGDSGTDLADYSNATANLSIDLFEGTAFHSVASPPDTLFGIENVYGGSGNDRITGNDADNFLYGGGGNDTIHGLAGNDTLKGGAGHDHLFGDADNDLLIANDTHPDILDGGDGTDSGKVDADNLDSVRGVEELI